MVYLHKVKSILSCFKDYLDSFMNHSSLRPINRFLCIFVLILCVFFVIFKCFVFQPVRSSIFKKRLQQDLDFIIQSYYNYTIITVKLTMNQAKNRIIYLKLIRNDQYRVVDKYYITECNMASPDARPEGKGGVTEQNSILHFHHLAIYRHVM